MNGLADAKIAWYPAALSLWGHLLRLMAPELFIATQTIRPSDFWTECILYLGRNLFSPAMRQHFTCPPGLTLNIFSSEKNNPGPVLFFHFATKLQSFLGEAHLIPDGRIGKWVFLPWTELPDFVSLLKCGYFVGATRHFLAQKP